MDDRQTIVTIWCGMEGPGTLFIGDIFRLGMDGMEGPGTFFGNVRTYVNQPAATAKSDTWFWKRRMDGEDE
jgi:hypothetical protein